MTTEQNNPEFSKAELDELIAKAEQIINAPNISEQED